MPVRQTNTKAGAPGSAARELPRRAGAAYTNSAPLSLVLLPLPRPPTPSRPGVRPQRSPRNPPPSDRRATCSQDRGGAAERKTLSKGAATGGNGTGKKPAQKRVATGAKEPDNVGNGTGKKPAQKRRIRSGRRRGRPAPRVIRSHQTRGRRLSLTLPGRFMRIVPASSAVGMMLDRGTKYAFGYTKSPARLSPACLCVRLHRSTALYAGTAFRWHSCGKHNCVGPTTRVDCDDVDPEIVINEGGELAV